MQSIQDNLHAKLAILSIAWYVPYRKTFIISTFLEVNPCKNAKA